MSLHLKGWVPLALGLIAIGPSIRAQDTQRAAQADVNTLARQMAEHVRRLNNDISTGLDGSLTKQNLGQDTQELARGISEFEAVARDRPDPSRLRQVYGGIEASWRNLRARLAQPGVSTAAVKRSARSVDELDVQLHNALGLNDAPQDFYGPGPAPLGPADTTRLARALDDRAQALSAAIKADMANAPNRDALTRLAANLVKQTDIFHDSLANLASPGMARDLFSPVAAIADPFERELSAIALPPRVQSAWQLFASAELALRQNLDLPTPPPNVSDSQSSAPGKRSPIVELAETLLAQVDTFLTNFAPTAGYVPEGGFFLADAQRLRDAADNFASDAARGLTTSQLALEFRDVDASWRRLASRVIRVARGRTGPNINLALSMGDTIAQIQDLLDTPGSPSANALRAPTGNAPSGQPVPPQPRPAGIAPAPPPGPLAPAPLGPDASAPAALPSNAPPGQPNPIPLSPDINAPAAPADSAPSERPVPPPPKPQVPAPLPPPQENEPPPAKP